MIAWQWAVAALALWTIPCVLFGRWWRGFVAHWCEDCGYRYTETHECPEDELPPDPEWLGHRASLWTSPPPGISDK